MAAQSITTSAQIKDVLIREDRQTYHLKRCYCVTIVYEWINRSNQEFEVTLNGEYDAEQAAAIAQHILVNRGDHGIDLRITV